jgi:hypothetical protein
VPSYAQPAGGSDAHLTVIDQSTTPYTELDCWSTSNLSGTGGTITAQACGSGPINGTGLTFGQTGAGYAQWAGVIRSGEFVANSINHALFIIAPCTQNASVYPSNVRSTDTQCSGNQGPPYGARFRLAMTDAQILALGAPVWKEAIYFALAHYGAYVGDTNGNNNMSFQFESDLTYSLASYTNAGCPTNGAPCTPVTVYAKAQSIPFVSGTYYSVNLSEVNWATYGQWLLPPPTPAP